MKQFLYLALIFINLSLVGQNAAALYSKLNEAKTDTDRLPIYLSLAESYLYDNYDSAYKYIELVHKFDKVNFKAALYESEIARLEKRYEDSRYIIDQLKIKGVSDQLPILEIREDLIWANIYETELKRKDALEKYLSAVQKSKEFGDKNEMLITTMALGIYYKRNNDVTNGLNYLLEAFKLGNLLKKPHFIFTCAINLGTLYEMSNESERALVFYRKALGVADDENAKAISYFKMGKVFARIKGRLDSSLFYIRKTMDIHLKRKDEVGLIFDYSAIGNFYSSEGRVKEAEEYYLRSIELALKYKDSIRIVNVYSTMATSYKNLGNSQKAIDYYQLSLKYLCLGLNPETVSIIYQRMSEIYRDRKQYQEAYKYLALHDAMKDSLNNVNDTKRQTEFKMNFEFNQIQDKLKAEAEAKELISKSESDKQKQQRNYLIIGIVLVSLFLVLAIRSYRQKRKDNFVLEKQKLLIEFQKKMVEVKNREISDSINYALHIQTASLPEMKELDTYFKDYGLFFKPKDVVSGDFYWAAATDDVVLFAVADCTGHGVPGAITSMIGSMLLNEIFYVKKIYEPDKVLTELNRLVKLTLRQESQSLSKDGMDIAFCSFNKKTNRLLYAGANRPLYITNTKGLLEFKATKASVGGYVPLIQAYELNEVVLEKDSTIVLSSDGYTDQFGGANEKKFSTKAFKSLLQNIAHKTAEEQKVEIEKAYEAWRTNTLQTDDVLVFVTKV